ncbi:hypothetical protein HanHA300_Chr05g0170751 [Helianthus annuus]|nr:hypothetical protein HanHA300_Chr05g0170751 [Helianthus annuus]KAJ0584129.1 hypothetical protein HanHA89_Chr05g0184951 [Helianthus annuus]KAJ0746716.1 hypothetical protein HanOQP8_Chr05g0181161 [Helianthus annuus]KAJ0749795.1 hypothetical protein HanLR1_Chr05g0174311 [Helianthus annuus]
MIGQIHGSSLGSWFGSRFALGLVQSGFESRFGLGSGQTRYGPCSVSVLVSVERIKDGQHRGSYGRSSQREPFHRVRVIISFVLLEILNLYSCVISRNPYTQPL